MPQDTFWSEERRRNFQRVMDNELKNFQHKIYLVYMDQGNYSKLYC